MERNIWSNSAPVGFINLSMSSLIIFAGIEPDMSMPLISLGTGSPRLVSYPDIV